MEKPTVRLSNARTQAFTLAFAVALVSPLQPWSWTGAGAGVARGEEGTPNACGCYQDSSGSCFCGKKARCGCPGACEPKGCEDKRDKEMRKEIEAETRKAQEAGRRYRQSNSGDERASSEAAAGREHEAAPGGRGRGKDPAERRSSPHLTSAQRKELLRLLDLYAGEHADRGGRTLEQLRGELATSP